MALSFSVDHGFQGTFSLLSCCPVDRPLVKRKQKEWYSVLLISMEKEKTGQGCWYVVVMENLKCCPL